MQIIGDNGLGRVKGILPPGYKTPAAPDGAVLIGMDETGANWCYVQTFTAARAVIGNANSTSAPQTLKYTVSSGSTIGFSQELSVSVQLSASINFLVVSATAGVTIT